MTQDLSNNQSLNEFAEKFTQQVRSGCVASTEELQDEYPELPDDLKGFAKTLSILEEAGFQHRTRGASPSVADVSGQRWTRVGGFRLIREINRGGMGIVYEAEQEALQRRVAIKVLPSSPMLTEKQLTRFKREGTAIARLHHSHIVPVFGSGDQNGVHYCVMQYIEGCSLDRLIRALRRKYKGAGDAEPVNTEESQSADVIDSGDETLSQDQELNNVANSEYPSVEALKILLNEDASIAAVGQVAPAIAGGEGKKGLPFPAEYWKNVARIGADMADALSHAHGQGVLHRDVKPANLLIDSSGHVWLADFGVAKLMDHDNLTVTGGLVGTLRYSPPEQFQGESDARSDIYSLGLTLYELCALQPAFMAKDRRELMRLIAETTPVPLSRLAAGIPTDLETVIHKAIAPNPCDRYQNADVFATDLNRFIEGRSVTARRLTILEKCWRWCRRHRTETALGSVIALLLISFGLTASVAYVREARLRQESDQTAKTALAAINRVYDSYVPDWTTSSTVSAHGAISVSPATAQTLAGLVKFYDELAERTNKISEVDQVFEATAALRRVALIYHRLGMIAESRDAYGQALVRLRSLTEQSQTPRMQLELARVSNEIGAVYWTDRKIEEAIEAHQNAFEILQEIKAIAEPGLRREFLFEKARTGYLLGRRGRGRLGGVPLRPVITRKQERFDMQTRSSLVRADALSEAFHSLDELLAENPGSPTYRHLQALCYRELTDGTIRENNPADASIMRAIELLDQLVKENPEHSAYRYSLCTTLLWLNLGPDPGDCELTQASERIDRAIRIAEELSQERPDEWIYPAAVVEAYLLKANVQSRGGMADLAHTDCMRAVEVGTRLVEKYPRCTAFQYWVGVAHRADGENLISAGNT
ncbi:MAG: serine/threonine protein kinase, partial [Planctomycetaceae bacterium]|nr:serine/threonine protein kinase [Planctomycetaceae bacterium]